MTPILGRDVVLLTKDDVRRLLSALSLLPLKAFERLEPDALAIIGRLRELVRDDS